MLRMVAVLAGPYEINASGLKVTWRGLSLAWYVPSSNCRLECWAAQVHRERTFGNATKTHKASACWWKKTFLLVILSWPWICSAISWYLLPASVSISHWVAQRPVLYSLFHTNFISQFTVKAPVIPSSHILHISPWFCSLMVSVWALPADIEGKATWKNGKEMAEPLFSPWCSHVCTVIHVCSTVRRPLSFT